jgi:acyl carrier protein
MDSPTFKRTSMKPTSTTFDDVKTVVINTLGIEDRADSLLVSTALLDSMPELDSLAVVQLVYALEERFGFTIADDEVTADVFETMGSVVRFIESKRR